MKKLAIIADELAEQLAQRPEVYERAQSGFIDNATPMIRERLEELIRDVAKEACARVCPSVYNDEAPCAEQEILEAFGLSGLK